MRPTTVAPRPPRRVAPAPPPTSPAPEVVLRTSVTPFHWDQVVSSDFFAYRDNLRAVGCPDRTLRDILLSEVNRTYAARADDLIRPIASRFWDVLAEMVHDEKAMEGKYRMIERYRGTG